MAQLHGKRGGHSVHFEVVWSRPGEAGVLQCADETEAATKTRAMRQLDRLADAVRIERQVLVVD